MISVIQRGRRPAGRPVRALAGTIYGLLWAVAAAAQAPEPPLSPPPPGQVQAWVTTGDGVKRLERQPDLAWSPVKPVADVNIAVDEMQKYQTIEGFGASIADLGVMNAAPAVRAQALQQLFGRSTGIGLSVLRVPMGSLANNGPNPTYDDLPAGQTDPTLAHFSLAGDLAWRLPYVQQARQVNPEVEVLGTPWTAPAWMKDSGELGKGRLKPELYGVYAQYFRKWIEGWRAEGVGVSAVTLQNEPHFEPGWYQGMRMDAADEANFVKTLGPTLRDAGLSPRLIVWDHNWDEPNYPADVLKDPVARPWVDGAAFHGYAGNPDVMADVHAANPDNDLYFTEATGGLPGDGFGGSLLYHLRYFFITPLRNWARTVLLWKLDRQTDDLTGDRPFVRISADGKSETLYGEYYEMGQFSRFVRRGAYRIASDNPGQAPGHEREDGPPLSVAFQNPDGTKVLVVATQHRVASFSVENESRFTQYALPADSVATFVWRDEAGGGGLAASYYDGAPGVPGVRVQRVDPTVDFDWTKTPPDPALRTGALSVQWTGFLRPPRSGKYVFSLSGGDRIRLSVDGRTVLRGLPGKGGAKSLPVSLTASRLVPVSLEYYRQSGPAKARLSWAGPQRPMQIVPRACLYATRP